MRKIDYLLIGILLVALVLCFGLGLRLDPNNPAANTPTGEYHVQINEICAKNETVIADNDGKYRDYIELYNPGPETDLAGCRLTDGSVTYCFDSLVMGAGEYRLLFLGSETTGFALSASGRDSIQLQDPAGNIISQAKLHSLNADQVMIFTENVWQISDQPTPGFPNNSAGATAFLTGTAAESLALQISEVLIANELSLPDEKGIFSDVVELHNPTDAPIRLSGWYLSDSLAQRFRFRLPDMTIPAGAYLLIYCDGENLLTDQGILHANFALTAQEELCLTDPSGSYVTVRPQHNGNDISLALTGEGYQPMLSSLGYANTEQGCSDAWQSRIDPQCPILISEVLTDDTAVPYNGRLMDVVELWNRSDKPVDTAHWYLSDGSDPYTYPLPKVTLAPGERMVLPLSQQLTGFAISPEETLYLMTPQYFFSQPVTCTGIVPGSSISLTAGDPQPVYDLMEVSLGFENTPEGARQFQTAAASQGLRISEAMSSNGSYLLGPYRNATDWVELYNAGSEPILLSDYCLTDSDDLRGHALPDKTLEPGAYIVILLSESETNLPRGYSRLPFTLSADGDQLYLTKNGIVEDYMILPALSGDTAWGRPAAAQYAAQLSTPTPGKPNSPEASLSQTPVVSLPQGAYNNVTELTISFSGPGRIYYTTDCTVPTQYSKLYTGPITITSTTVFRVAAYEDGCTRSQILDLTYLVNEGGSLSFVSLVTTPKNLWDTEVGIYATGNNAAEAFPHLGANYWENWEKSGSVTLFDTDGSLCFSENCGIKMFGGYSRSYAKKSFACMFRSKYGQSSLNYPLFGEEGLDTFQNFVLRAGGQDFFATKFRDEMLTSLASEHLGLPVQRYRPVVLYLNGQYWGIYFIREKLNDQYVAGNFNAHKEDVTLSYYDGSDSKEFTELLRYARTHDMRDPEHYEYVCSQINVQNYMDYIITQMWIENDDLSNVKFFKTPDIPWHWALYDTDISMYNVSRNSVRIVLSKAAAYSHDPFSRALMVRLLENPEFKDAFLRRMAWQLNNVWTEENVVAGIDYFHDLLKDDIERECKRWGPSLSDWERIVQRLRNFAAKRTGYMLDHIQDHFDLTTQQMREYGFEV